MCFKQKKGLIRMYQTFYEIELELETVNEKAVRITVELDSLVLMMLMQPAG